MLKTPNKSNRLLIILPLFIILAIFVLGIYQKLKTGKTINLSKQESPHLIPSISFEDITSNWETYFNLEYGFKLKYPRFLYPIETKNVGGYLAFVRFIENDFSQGKGVGIGMRKTTLSDEVEQIKKEIGHDIEAVLITEDKFMVNSLLATKLIYEPKNPDEGEPRAIVILNNEKYSFSISTTPEQIDIVISSFSLGMNFRGCQNILSFESDQPFLQSYCQGEYCFKEITKESCEKVDVVKFVDQGLFEESGKDGIGDCVWQEVVTPNHCSPRF